MTLEADIRRFANKGRDILTAIARGSAQDTGELMSVRQASIRETGTFQVGKVPVDTGQLVSSQQASVNGGIVAFGDVAYSAAVGGFDIGDVFEAVYTAEYARFMEYGFTTQSGTVVPGRFYVANAVQQWPAVVAANAAQFGDL